MQRLDYQKLAPEAIRAMDTLGKYLAGCGLEASLLERVTVRAWQINGWNRLAISCGVVPGTYKPASTPA